MRALRRSWSAASLPPLVRVVRIWGLRVIATIALLNVLLGLLQYVGAMGTPVEGSWPALIDVNHERNLPTWFSTLFLAGASAAAAGVASVHRPRGSKAHRWWMALAALYALASLDEAVSLHERLIVPVRDAFDLSGALYSAWVVPGLVVIAVLTAVFWRFAATLPRDVKWRFGLGTVVFFTGAVGFEMAGAAMFTSLGAGALSGLMALAEETLELLGALLWLEAMLIALVPRAGCAASVRAAAEESICSNSETAKSSSQRNPSRRTSR